VKLEPTYKIYCTMNNTGNDGNTGPFAVYLGEEFEWHMNIEQLV